MTVAELITELSKFPDDMRVVVSGYEAGYDEAEPVRLVKAHLVPVEEARSPNAGGVYGVHGTASEPGLTGHENTPLAECVLIGPNDYGEPT